MGPLAVIGLVVAGLALMIVMISVISRAVAARARERIAQAYPADQIVYADEMANSFGIESKGAVQLRGNGGLVLTRDTLHFLPLAGGTEVRIPLGSIRAVTVVKSHLGKTVGRPLLRVEYDEGGRTDAVAWFVRDVPAWQQHLEQARR